MKTDFINNLTHEFNTPMANIALAIETISDTERRTPKLSRLLNIISSEAYRLRENIERALEIATLERGSLQLRREPVDLVALIKTVIPGFQSQCEALGGGIVFRHPDEATVFGDEVHLLNAICNILDNAIRYRRGEPQIRIGVTAGARQVSVQISDNGIGMSAETQRHIFEKFYRAQRGNVHDTKGFGLGLNYVRAYGRSTAAASRSGAAPAAAAHSPFNYRSPMEQADNSAARILLVEDETHLGYLLLENLQAKGYTVSLATTGTEGVQALQAQEFDLCIRDIMLPGEDGFSVASQLRRLRPGLPFLFLTARGQEADRLRGFELGADDYVQKPFSFRQLDYRLQVILRRSGRQRPAGPAAVLTLGSVQLDCAARVLRVGDAERRLSQREAALLQMLMSAGGGYVTRSEILKALWGRDDFFTAKSMDVYLTRIRKLLKEAPGVEINNLYGSGYRIRLTGQQP